MIYIIPPDSVQIAVKCLCGVCQFLLRFCSRGALAQSCGVSGKSSEWPQYGNVWYVIMAKPWQIPSLKWIPATVLWYSRARCF